MEAQTIASSPAPAGGPPEASLDGLMDFIGDPSSPEQPEEAAAGESEPAETPVEAQEPAKPAEKPKTKAETLEELASQYGLDSKNPQHRKFLTDLQAATKRNADKDEYIEKLKGGSLLSDLLADAEPEPETEQAANAKPVQKPEAPKPEMQGRPKFGDVGDNWQYLEDSQPQLIEAWNKGDHRTAMQIQNALFTRQMMQFTPVLENFVKHMIESQVGPLRPMVEAYGARQSQDEGIALARQQVRGLSDGRGELFNTMMKPDSEEALVIDGERLPNSPLNRILQQHPYILDLRVQHDDPKEAARRTALKQYEAAMTVYRHQMRTAAPDAAKKLVDAGKKLADKTAQDEARRKMNAGKPSGAGTASNGSFLDEIAPKGSELTMSQIFTRRP